MFLYNYILLLKKIAFYEINKLLSVFTYDWVNLTIKNIGKLSFTILIIKLMKLP